MADGPDGDPFVARGAELAALHQHLRETRTGNPRVVLVEGEAGIGKTVLVRRFLREVGDTPVLRAGADDHETAVTYGVVAQLVEALRPSQLRDAPGLRSGPAPTTDPLVIGGELASVLRGMSASVVIVEDLHWADLPSSDALLLAARRLRGGTVLLVITHRPDELGRLGGRWERFAAGDERCARLRLSGFDVPAVTALAAAMGVNHVDRAAAQRLREHTEGNPLYVRALLEELPASALRSSSGPLPAPRSLADVIAGRLAELPGAARSLVVAAAILGRSCPLSAAVALGGVEDPAEVVDQAHRARLLEEVPGSGGRDVAFSHPLVHAAVYGDLGPGQRRRLHRAAAALVEGREALGHRVAATAGADEELASDLETDAEAEAARGAFAEAALHAVRASELSRDRPASQRRLIRSVDLLLRAGDMVTATSRRPEVELCRPTAARQQVLGRLAFLSGRVVEAETLLRSAWESRTAADWEPAAAAAADLGEFWMLAGRSAEAERLLREAVAECPPDAPRRCDLVAMLAFLLALRGCSTESDPLLDSAFAGDATTCPPEQLDAMIVRSIVRVHSDDPHRAVSDFTTLLQRAHEGLSGPRLVQALCHLGEAEFRSGLWDAALEHHELAVTTVHDAELSWAFAFAHALAAGPSIGRGDWDTATTHVETARAAADAYAVTAAVAYAATAAATLAWARRRPEETLAALDALRDLSGGGIGEPGILQHHVPHVDALLLLGRLDEADAVLTDLERRAEQRCLASAMLDGARLRGSLESARGCTVAAERAFSAGGHLSARVPAPLSRALFRLECGRFLRSRRCRREALDELRGARAILVGLGAKPFIELVDAELAHLGMARSAAQTPLDLNGRERDVARLAAAGRSNREIAEELFLSTKTVEYHLAKIYAKMGVRSRTELSVRLTRQD